MKKILLAAAVMLALVAATPAPKAAPHPAVIPPPPLPKIALHTAFVVEVNAKGQVVRVQKAISKNENLMFNAQTYGNVLQMWIRHPDGTAEVGLYRVDYNYDPKTHKVRRSITLLKAGGSWAKAEGAATQMMNVANREAKAAREHQQRQNRQLPSLRQIVGPSPSAKPSPRG
jgi:hypothetical protein